MLQGRLGCIAVSIRNKRGELATRWGARPWRVFATMSAVVIMTEGADGCFLRLVAGGEL